MSNHILIAKSILGATAEWRRRVLLSHSNDHRNTTAAELLDRLAIEPISTVMPELIAQLECYSDSEFSREAKLAAKLVGFRSFPGTLSSFVADVIQRINCAHAKWENAFHSAEGAR